MRPHLAVTAILLAHALPVLAIAAQPGERSWMDQVERDRDRGAGRIVDEPTWQVQRQRERADVRLGRLKPRREFERFDEERDRDLQIEAAARHTIADGGATEDPSAILRQRPIRGGGAGISPLAAVVAREQRELAEAKQTLERSLRAVDVAHSRALRMLRRRLTREGRPEQYDAERPVVDRRFESLRAAHQRVYDQVRSRILGNGASR
jgi:hypothetical protein